METLYCTIDAKRIVVTGAAREQAAGGTSTVRYTVIPRRDRAEIADRGKVLSLDDYRRRMEEESRLPEEAPQEPDEAQAGAARSGSRLGLGLELMTSAAVMGMTLVVALKFLML